MTTTPRSIQARIDALWEQHLLDAGEDGATLETFVDYLDGALTEDEMRAVFQIATRSVAKAAVRKQPPEEITDVHGQQYEMPGFVVPTRIKVSPADDDTRSERNMRTVHIMNASVPQFGQHADLLEKKAAESSHKAAAVRETHGELIARVGRAGRVRDALQAKEDDD